MKLSSESDDTMKTISEIQNEIKDMNLKLSELFNELEELKPKDNINKQTDFSKISLLASQYPIKEHRVKNADNYTKKLYLIMLSTIAQTNNDNKEEKLVFLDRILLGIKYEGEFESIVKEGMEVDDSIIDDFINCMKDNECKQLFILESLIISNLGGELDDIAKKYISELISYLGIEKNEVMFLIELSICVLEQSKDKYKQLTNRTPKTVDITLFFNSYLRNFVNGIICDNSSMYYVCDINADTEMIRSISNKDLEGRKVIFKNVKFDLKAANNGLNLKQACNISFDNCNFNSEDNDIIFEAVNSISFYNCKFEEFNEGVCIFNCDCENVKIEKCVFEKCGYLKKEPNDFRNGGCLLVDQISSFILKDSEFTNCYIKGWLNSAAIACINKVNNLEINNVSCRNCKAEGNSFSPLFWVKNIDGGSRDEYQKYFINCKTINCQELF